ncbi:MAG: ABC transporter permease [Bacilli bacterium]|nr:ABC transporter permease [Bacilli bacterium]
MFKLVKIELLKILKHKSIYIVLAITFSFCLLNNIIYKNDYNNEGFYKYTTNNNINKQIKKLEKENNKYDINKESDKTLLIENKTKIEILKIKKQYSKEDWRYIKAKDYLYDTLYKYNYHKYIDNDTNKIEYYNNKYNNYKDKIKKNNWMYFLKKEKKELNNNIKDLINIQNNSNNTKDKLDINNTIKELKSNLTIINYRINKKINYNNTYLNQALKEYKENLQKEKYCKNLKKLNYNKKLECYNTISSLNINKYIINKKINVNKVNTLNYQLRTIADDYELFIVLIIIISSSILISEEFNKGTIKQLLIKPYKRSTILISKIIACFIMLSLVITYLFLTHLIIGGILFSFSSLKNAVIVYNFTNQKIMKINIFIYMILRIFSKLPMYIIIINISIIFGIIINSVVGSFSLIMLIYTFSELINNLAINYKLKFMRLSITMNWNFKEYLFGGLSTFKYLDFKKSLLIFIIYDIITIGIMLISFARKNIKNI